MKFRHAVYMTIIASLASLYGGFRAGIKYEGINNPPGYTVDDAAIDEAKRFTLDAFDKAKESLNEENRENAKRELEIARRELKSKLEGITKDK